MQTLSLYIHILGAILLVGGMLFFTLIAAPYLRGLEDKKETALHFQGLGKRFKTIGLIAWAMLLITGPLNLYLMGFNSFMLSSFDFWSSDYGKILLTKILLVLLLITTSLVHDLVIGPKSRTSQKYSAVTKIVGRGNLVIALIIVLFAVILRFSI